MEEQTKVKRKRFSKEQKEEILKKFYSLIAFLLVSSISYSVQSTPLNVIRRIAEHIPTKLDMVSEVYDVSIREITGHDEIEDSRIKHYRKIHASNNPFVEVMFILSFTIRTSADAHTPNAVFEDITCISWVETIKPESDSMSLSRKDSSGNIDPIRRKLVLAGCESGQVQIDKKIELPFE